MTKSIQQTAVNTTTQIEGYALTEREQLLLNDLKQSEIKGLKIMERGKKWGRGKLQGFCICIIYLCMFMCLTVASCTSSRCRAWYLVGNIDCKLCSCALTSTRGQTKFLLPYIFGRHSSAPSKIDCFFLKIISSSTNSSPICFTLSPLNNKVC